MKSGFYSCWLALAVAISMSGVSMAQSNYYFRTPDSEVNGFTLPAPAGPDGDYNNDDNWFAPSLQLRFIPDHTQGFGERAYIENGGTAFVSGIVPFSAGQLVMGSASGTSGTLEIQGGGTLATGIGSKTNGNINVGSSGGVGTLRVLPGGTLTAANSIVEGNNPNNMLQVGTLAGGGTATLSGASFAIGSRVQVFPSAAFSTTGAGAFFSTANYSSEITGNGANGKIDVGATATLAGTLELHFNGAYTPSVGDNWNVIQAASYTGDFGAITANTTLASNQSFVVSKPDVGGGKIGYNVSLQEVMVLEVNRNSGTATITHPGSSNISLDGYFVGSDVGGLNPAGRTSVNGQSSLGNDWVDTAATPYNVGELKIASNGIVAGGDVASISLGSIFDATAGPLGQNNEDLEFSYRRADGTKFPGRVQYVGDKYNTLVLYLDPMGSGDAILRNASDKTAIIDSYEILSEAGRLTTAGWNSLHEQEFEGLDTWLEVDSNANQIGEFNGTAFTTLGPNEILNLGPLYLGGVQDLELNFLQQADTEGVGTAGRVLYETYAPIVTAGDYNGNGIVDAADYTIWRDTLGSTTDLRANGDNTGGSANKIDAADYAFWKSRFGNTSGSGASGISGSAVPEPTTWLLVTLAGIAAVIFRYRKRLEMEPKRRLGCG